MTAVFADSWAWIVLFNRQDQYHKEALQVWQDLLREKRSIITSEFVWIETLNAMSLPGMRGAAIRGMDRVRGSEAVKTVGMDAAHLQRGLDLYRARTDKGWSLTDCISFVIMEEQGLSEAFTGDRHFEQCGFRILLK